MIQFKFEFLNTVQKEDIYFLFESGANSSKKYPETVSIQDGEIIIDQKFKNTGFYDVHLYIKDDLIATYTVEVNR